MPGLPLIRHADLRATLAWRNGRPVTAAQFLGEVAQVAARLPARGNLLNLCSDRYRFAVGLAAALTRRQISLLPPNQTPEMLTRLARAHPDMYCLTDTGFTHPAMPSMAYPDVDASVTADEVPAFPAAQVAACLFTSGSTGEPTPHVKTWGSLVAGTLGVAERFDMAALARGALLGMVPPQHMFGLEASVMLPLQFGLAMHAGCPFYPADICAAIETLPHPRALITTPIHLRALLADAGALPQVDLMISATAPLAPQLAAEAEARFGAPLYEIYGCTEAGKIATRRTARTEEWQCLPGIALHRDAHGIWASGGPVEVPALLGDVLEVAGDGRFLLHGRLADMINIAGKRTSLAHLNHHLNAIEGVRDGAFVMPEEAPGGVTRLMAFVVAPGMTAKAIKAELSRRIDPVFLPRPLCLVDALPRNTTGKLPRETVQRLVALAEGQQA